MSAATPRLPDYLQYIIESIERIQRYTEDMARTRLRAESNGARRGDP